MWGRTGDGAWTPSSQGSTPLPPSNFLPYLLPPPPPPPPTIFPLYYFIFGGYPQPQIQIFVHPSHLTSALGLFFSKKPPIPVPLILRPPSPCPPPYACQLPIMMVVEALVPKRFHAITRLTWQWPTTVSYEHSTQHAYCITLIKALMA